MLCCHRLQNAVTYIAEAPFFAGSVPCLADFLSGLQSVDFVNILNGRSFVTERRSVRFSRDYISSERLSSV